MNPYRSRSCLIALGLMFQAGVAAACSCARTSAEEKFDSADHVFVARITAVSDPDDRSFASRFVRGTRDPGDPQEQGLHVSFVVEHTIKGQPELLDHLVTGYGGGDCGLDLRPGRPYLIATRDNGYVGYCGLEHEVPYGDCQAVHMLWSMRQRAADGTTALQMPQRGLGNPDAFEFLIRGVPPWEVNPADCPLGDPEAPNRFEPTTPCKGEGS